MPSNKNKSGAPSKGKIRASSKGKSAAVPKDDDDDSM
jgi:hypothetical protein